jgi:hypothetical protein
MSWNRDSTTPMDFEYQNRSGPVDQNSPFIKALPQQPGKKRKLNLFASEATADAEGHPLNLGPPFGHLGSHVALESPSKNGFSTPNRPQLREPHSERFLFSEQSRPIPSIPSHVSSSWTPRTPPNVIDCSSGGETPNTPGFNDDSDAPTPDTKIEHNMGRLEGEADKSSKKGRRISTWSKLASKFAASPSPTKETKQDSNPFYSKKAENRVMKRRAKSTTRKATVQDYDSDSDQHKSKDSSRQQSQPGMAMGLAGFFAWIEAHPNLPSVLSFYLQLLVNLFLGCGFMYLLYAAWSGIMNDVSIESHKSMIEVMVEIGACAKDYNANRCAPETRVPAMENICSNWEKCMQRDPKKVARASVTARTFAMIFNSFVEEFSYKSMVFLAFLIFLSIFLINIVRSFTRWMRYDQPIES